VLEVEKMPLRDLGLVRGHCVTRLPGCVMLG